MVVDTVTHRVRTGTFCRYRCCINKGRKCEFFSLDFFSKLLITILLLIGGVEMNPGPQESGVSLEAVLKKLDSMSEDIGAIKGSISSVNESVNSLKLQLVSLNKKYEELKKENTVLVNKIEVLENHSRRQNLVFYNLEELENENWETTENRIREVITEELKIVINDYDIERAHRLGRKSNYNRPVIVRFANYKKKMEVLSSRELKKSKIGVSEDYSAGIRQLRSKLKPYMLEARKKGYYAVLRFNKVKIEDRYYTLEDLQSMSSGGEEEFGHGSENQPNADYHQVEVISEQRNGSTVTNTPLKSNNQPSIKSQKKKKSGYDVDQSGVRQWLSRGVLTRSQVMDKPRRGSS